MLLKHSTTVPLTQSDMGKTIGLTDRAKMNDTYQTRPLSDGLGIALTGVRISRGIDRATIDTIVNLLYRHGVLCIPDQELTPGELAEFGACLGRPVHHNEEDLRLDGLPGVMSLSNADDRDDRQLNGGAHWHTDLVYTDEPASFTMLNAIAVPPSGGGTLFANQAAAYEALPETMRRKVDTMTVIHCYEGRTDGSMPLVRQPLVRSHPVTGVRALYGAADTGIGIEGMSDEPARAFLSELAEHATADRFVYRHGYRRSDIVIWDNSQLLHCAERLKRSRAPEHDRIMHRVSVRGWPDTALLPAVQ